MAAFRPVFASKAPLLVGATLVGATSYTYYSSRRPLMMDSAQSPPLKTLSFPKTMLFSQQLKVTHVEQVNHDTKKITFALPGGDGEISGVAAGAALLTQHWPTERWFPVLRPYTPISSASDRGTLELLVKHYPGGAASTQMHALQPGQSLTVRGPIPGYTWNASTTPRDMLLVAGGAGITPIYSIAKASLADPADRTRIQLVWGVNGTRDIVLKTELEALQAAHPDRLRVTYCVSGTEALPTGDEGMYKQGYVDRGVLKEVIQRCESGSFGDEKGTKVLICGPPKMEDALKGKNGVLQELGVTKKQVYAF